MIGIYRPQHIGMTAHNFEPLRCAYGQHGSSGHKPSVICEFSPIDPTIMKLAYDLNRGAEVLKSFRIFAMLIASVRQFDSNYYEPKKRNTQKFLSSKL